MMLPAAYELLARTVSESNAHDHWRARHRRAKAQRLQAIVATKVAVPRLGLHLDPPLIVTLTRVAPRGLDDDNLRGALKAVRDGVADALGIDDRDPRVTWCYAQEKGEGRLDYRVRIRICRRTLQASPSERGAA